MLWLLVAPIPGAITTLEVPSVIRAFPMIVPLIAFIALGIYAIAMFSYTKPIYRYTVCGMLLVLYLGGFSYFWFQFTVQQPHYHPWNRFYGAERLPDKVKQYINEYEEIRVGSNQYVYFALDDVISINTLQESYPERQQKEARFENIVFDDSGCNVYASDKKILFVVKPECTKNALKIKGIEEIDRVDFKDGNPAYIFYEVIPSVSQNTL